jgi:hypothetical protein
MPRSITLAAALALALAAAPLLGCAPPVIVLSQASAGPLTNQTRFGLMPVDYAGVVLESEEPAEMSPLALAAWAKGEAAIAFDLSSHLVERARANGLALVQVAAPGDAPFLVWPRVTYIDRGTGSHSDLRVRVRITSADGRLVDEIAVRHTTPDDAHFPTPTTRLLEDSRVIAALVADHLARRARPAARAEKPGDAAVRRAAAEPVPEPLVTPL